MRGLTPTLVLFLVTTSVGAHPVPADNRDRTVVIRLAPAGITVDYRLEIDELSATRNCPRTKSNGSSPASKSMPPPAATWPERWPTIWSSSSMARIIPYAAPA